METSKDISTQKGKYINTDSNSGRDQSGSIKLFYAAVIRRAGQDHDNQQRHSCKQYQNKRYRNSIKIKPIYAAFGYQKQYPFNRSFILIL